MEGKQVFSIVIALLMVGSIVGFTAFYTFPDQENGGDNGSSGPEQPATAIPFIAEGVEATVFQMLPSVKIQAETKETDIIALNNSIYGIDGIKRVNGSFQQWPYTSLGTGFIYLADISFDSDLNSALILEKLEEETSLQFIEGYNYALIELPKTVSMDSEDSDLGLSREYEFSESITEALIGLESIEDDVILVELTATFIGEEATNLIAFESENITATPVEKSTSLFAPISELEPTLLFSAEAKRSQLSLLQNLEQDANSIEGVMEATVFVPEIAPNILITSLSNAEEEKFSAFEAFLNDLNAESVSIENQPLSGTVSFGSEISSQAFLEKLSAVEEKVLELGIDAIVVEQTGFLSGQATLESEDSSAAGPGLEALLEAANIEAEVSQPAELSLASVSDGEGNIYFIPSKKVSAFLHPGHLVGEKPEVEVSFTLVRNLFDSGFAEEKE